MNPKFVSVSLLLGALLAGCAVDPGDAQSATTAPQQRDTVPMLDVAYSDAEFTLELLACLTSDSDTLESLVAENVDVADSGYDASSVGQAVAESETYCGDRFAQIEEYDSELLGQLVDSMTDAGLDPAEPIGEQDTGAVASVVDANVDQAADSFKKIRIDEKHIKHVYPDGGEVTICNVTKTE